MKFYTNVAVRGDNILYRGYENGTPIQEKVPFQPTVFVPTKEPSEWKTLHGANVEPFVAGGIQDTRKFIKDYKGVAGFSVHGVTDFQYQYISDRFPEEMDYDPSQLKTANIDIETTSDGGFPNPDNPTESIIAITVDFGGDIHVFGVDHFHIDRDDITCHVHTNERDMLLDFVSLWDNEKPDIVTGWNIRFFDIPYLVNRIQFILDNKEEKFLSPWRVLKERKITRMNREHNVYELLGIATLDYYELYTTFTYVTQESYRLDHIAFVELGERKLSYDEFDSMAEFYKKDFQKFVEYNVKDVELVGKLEDKLKLLELATSLAYSAKVNLMDIFSQVRTWDQIIYHFLQKNKIAIPPKSMTRKDTQYEGAYVKEPIAGKHDWIVSFDLNSLYPNLICQYNISPETLIDVGEESRFGVGPNNILAGREDSYGNKCYARLDELKSKGYSVAANGTCYRKDFQGFFPALMGKMYEERRMFKKKMIECQKEYEKVEQELRKRGVE